MEVDMDMDTDQTKMYTYYLEIELTKKLNDSTEILGMPMIFTFKAKSKIKKLRP